MKKKWMWLSIIILISFLLRFYFATETTAFSSSESYLHIRAIETIQQGKILWNDPLANRKLIMSPIFDLLIATFTFISPIAYKIIPNILASLITIPIFLTAYKLTTNKFTSITAAALASIIPAYFANTFNQITPLTLTIPLFFFTLYYWINKNNYTYLTCLLLLTLTTPLSIIFITIIGVYFFLATIEHIKPQKEEYELGIFSIFFALWAQFIIYKKIIVFHGIKVFWQNMPTQILNTYYSNISLLGAIAQIGVVPLIDGVQSIYKTAIKNPTRETAIIFSTVITITLALWFKLINPQTGFMLLGITLSITFAQGFKIIIDYLKQTKFAKHTKLICIALTIITFLSMTIPAYAAINNQLKNTITLEEIETLKEIKTSNSTIISLPNYGNYITYYSNQKIILDNYYLLQPRINEKYEDIKRIYQTSFETEAVEIMDKYHATHLIVEPKQKDITYGNQKCFKQITNKGIKIYEKNPECKIKIIT